MFDRWKYKDKKEN